MGACRAGDVDRWLARPDPAVRTVLIYGPDRGLVSERAALFAKASGADIDDPFSTIRLDADDAASDGQRIADEAHTVAMFGGTRLVWVSGRTQKSLINALQPVLDQPPQDGFVLVEAGDLKKSAALRTRVEKAASAMALPCYPDAARDLERLIGEELTAEGLSIEPEARQLLAALIGGDRLASRGELRKLALYARGQGTVTIADVEAIVGDAAARDLDALTDAALAGEMARLEQGLERLAQDGSELTTLMLALQRQVLTLHGLKARATAGGEGASRLVGGLRPPLPPARRNMLIAALERWSLDNLARTARRVGAAILDMRRSPDLAPAIVATTLMAIALTAAASAKGARRGR